MKFLVVLAVALVCAHADVSHVVTKSGEAVATIVRSDAEITPEGSYNYAYETSNGIAAHEEGVVKNVNSENAAVEVKGAVKYVAPDGTPIELTYIADENGFQPQGNHIPVPPPIPVAIARSLEYIAAHPPAAERQAAFVPAPAPVPVSVAAKASFTPFRG